MYRQNLMFHFDLGIAAKAFMFRMSIFVICLSALWMASPKQAAAGFPGSVFVNATQNDDTVIVDLEANTISVNGAVRSFTVPNNADICFDGRGGFDSLVVHDRLNPTGVRVARLSSEYASISVAGASPDPRIYMLNFDEIDFHSNSSENRTFVRLDRSTGDDYCLFDQDYAELRNEDTSFVFVGPYNSGFGIAPSNDEMGGHDQALIYGSPNDDYCVAFRELLRQFSPDQLRSVEMDRDVGSTGGYVTTREFDVTRIVARGGDDILMLEDSPGDDTMNLREGYLRWIAPNRDIRAFHFEDIVVSSSKGGSDSLVFEDPPSSFSEQTGVISDTASPRAISAPTYFAARSSRYDFIARLFEDVTYVPNGVDSLMIVFDSDGDDLFVDPKLGLQTGILAERNIKVLDGEGEPTRPNHLRFNSRTGDDTVKAFWLPTDESGVQSTASVDSTLFLSEGSTQVGQLFVPPTSFEAHDFKHVDVRQDGFCELAVWDSEGNDQFHLNPNRLRVFYPNSDLLVEGTGTDINFAATIVALSGDDRITVRGDGFNMFVDANHRQVAFAGPFFSDVPMHTASGFAEITALASGSPDGGTVWYTDSSGDDSLVATGGFVNVSAPNFSLKAHGASRFSSSGIRGGANVATIDGSATTTLNLYPSGWTEN